MATSFCARCSAVCDITREPVKRQMMITLAKPSMAESRPKPTSAIEPGHDPGGDRDEPLDAHRAERQPRQQLDPPRELAVALAARSSRRAARRAPRPRAAARPVCSARAPAAVTAASSARPRSVNSYMTILPSRVAPARPATRSARDMVGDELLVAADDPRQVAHARARAAASATATASRVGSPSALAPAAHASSSALDGRRRRAASAFGRSRQSSSQASDSVATAAGA